MPTLEAARAAVAAALLAVSPVLSPQEHGPYRFTWEGKPFTPELFPVNGDGATPSPGDVIGVGDFYLTLGAERECAFEYEGERLYRLEGGRRRLVAARLLEVPTGKPLAGENPPRGCSREEIAGLWGLDLGAWNEEIERLMAWVDLDRTCIHLTEGQAGRLRLPAGSRYLVISNKEHPENIADLAELRFLKIDFWSTQPRPGALANLTKIKLLDLSWMRELGDIDFVRGMKELKHLDISRSGVRSLEPIAGLPQLEVVLAAASAVSSLPREPLPALRKLDLLAARVPPGELERFQAMHPECAVYTRWIRRFREEVAGTTRVRIRSGGTCCRDADRERTLFEILDPQAIRELIDCTSILDEKSGFHCMCCGNPTFEFYRGDRLAAMVGFHHGRSLRWRAGWPGDALLSPESAGYYVELLARNGVGHPKQERDQRLRDERASRMRILRYAEILPTEFQASLEALPEDAGFAGRLWDAALDPVVRAALSLRLYGCGEIEWNRCHGLDEPLRESLLPGQPAEVLADAVRRFPGDGDLLNGLGRWLFWDGRWQKHGEAGAKAFRRILPAVGAHCLAHPSAYNRRRTMLCLARIRSLESMGLLLRFLAGTIQVRRIAEEDSGQPGGMVSISPDDLAMGSPTDDWHFAARMLGRLMFPRPLFSFSGSARGGRR